MFKYHYETGTLRNTAKISEDRSEKKFLFIAGDLSEIQDFIYSLSITNVKGASKILRARSLYLQALSEATVHYILNELGLPPSSNIINAGGRFITLAPNVDSVKKKLEEIEVEISKFFFYEFNAELTLNISYDVAFSADDLMRENFQNAISEIKNSLEKKKRKKIFKLIFKSGKVSFTFDNLYDGLTREGYCKFCGKNPAIKSIKDEEGESVKICRQCECFIDIGKQLTKAKAILYSKKKITDKSISLIGGKVWLTFYDKDEIKKIGASDELYYIELLNVGEKIIYPVKFIANYVPVWNAEESEIYSEVREINQEFDKAIGRIKTFGEIAKIGTIDKVNGEFESSGKAMLGILKADVDNFGRIFSPEFSKNMSISKYVTLSRLLDFYFTAYLNRLIETKINQTLYVVYSGGDDLLIVGEWKDIIDFAFKMYNKFREYTTRNKHITLSAGIALIGPRYPINRDALMADDFLEASKKYKVGDKEKDSLTIFNITVRWEFLSNLWKWKELFEKWLTSKNSKVSTTFMHRLLNYQRMAKEFYEEKNPESLRHTYLLKYDVTRNIIERKGRKQKTR